MARAGHSDFKTTQGYIDLAGETFRDEAESCWSGGFGASPVPKAGTKTPSRSRLRQRRSRLAGISSTGAEGLEPPTYGFGDRRSTN